MIDTCKPIVTMTKSIERVLRAAQTHPTPSVKVYGNHFFLPHPFGFQAIRVNFSLPKRLFWFETSLPKMLQGHNVFGSNHLERLCLAAIKLIYEHLKVRFSDEEARRILDARIRLGRLDITCSFRLKSPSMIDQVLEHLYEQFRAEGKAWAAYGKDSIETVYNQQGSTRVTDKYYNKGKELAQPGRGLPRTLANRQRILSIAEYLLRFEATYREKELRELGLNFADCWNTSQVRAELELRMHSHHLRGALSQTIPVAELHELAPNYSTFYGLWTDGANLAKYRQYRTLRRARQLILEHHRVDIFRRPKTGCSISLSELLNSSRALYGSPRWAMNKHET